MKRMSTINRLHAVAGLGRKAVFLPAMVGLMLASCEGQQEASDNYEPNAQILGWMAKDSAAVFTSETTPQAVKAGETAQPVNETAKAGEPFAPIDFSVPASVADADLSQLPKEPVEKPAEPEATSADAHPADSLLPQPRDFVGPMTRQAAALQGHAAQERLLDVPDNVGYRTGGVIAAAGNLSLYGERQREEHPNMLTAQRLNITAAYTAGDLTATAGATVNKYYALGVTTQYGVHGSLTYRFSPHVSATVFGEYYNRNPWISMAAFPFVSTSRYGGYLTLSGRRGGAHLGAERYYDPFVRRWELRPIVTPYVRIAKKITLELPLGGLLKEGADRLIHGRRHNGPIIMPTIY